jgi:hypothetical protein
VTGGPYLVEPIVLKDKFDVVRGEAAIYSERSSGSGKWVHLHSCANCHSTLHYSFERFPEVVGVFAGTLDPPMAMIIKPEITAHIFLDFAMSGTVIPAGVKTYRRHFVDNEGTRQPSRTYEVPHTIGDAASQLAGPERPS